MRRLATVIVVLGMVFIIQTHNAATQTAQVCPVLVQNALRQVERLCAGTGRNQICYGHAVLLAEPRPEISHVRLSRPGDITEIHNLSRVQLFPMTVDLEEWGVALMRVQANLPDTLPGQNVLFLLFGDVELAPEPSTELVATDSQAQEPITAFRLRSGIGTPLCEAAPPDGLLIQTPHGVGRVELTINGVDVNLGSTVFFTAQENDYLTVSALEGAALVRTEDGESIALAGSQVQVPLSENLQPAAPPMMPQAYDAEALNGLPLQMLDRPAEVAPPLTEQQIEVIQAVIEDGNSQALLPENTPTVTPAPECPESSCITPPGRTPTQADSSTQAQGVGEEPVVLRTGARTPDSPASTTPPTSRPTNPPTDLPTSRPTDPPPPTEPPPTDPPPTNCPGQSCDAPGHSGSCPGNSCNAPGHGPGGHGHGDDDDD